MKRLMLLGLMLLLIPTIAFAESTGINADFDETEYTVEIERATELDLIPPEWGNDFDAPVRLDEFTSMIFQAVKLASGKVIQPCDIDGCPMCMFFDRENDSTITRDEASQFIMLCVMEAYHRRPHGTGLCDPYEIFTLRRDMLFLSVRLPNPPINEHSIWESGELTEPYTYESVIYCTMQCDPVSGRAIMEPDADGWFRLSDFMTRGEAIIAAKRVSSIYGTSSFSKTGLDYQFSVSRKKFEIIKDPLEENASAESLLMDYETEEWQPALALGIVPEGFDTSGYVTPHEFMDMLKKTVALAGGDMTPLTSHLYDDWDKNDAVIRMDAAIAFTLAAEGMGIDTVVPNHFGPPIHTETDDALFEDAAQMFNILNQKHRLTWIDFDIVYDSIGSYAGYYVEYILNQVSFASGHPIMTNTEDAHFRYGTAITRKDAILGCWRLLTSKEPENDYMSPDEVGLNSNTMALELLAKQSELPPITKESFPLLAATHDWGQYCGTYSACDRYLSEDEVKAYKMAGVECLAMPYAFGLFEYPDFVPGQVNRWRLEDLDRVIALCIKYDIHLILDCNAFPGCGGYQFGTSDDNTNTLYNEQLMLSTQADIYALLRDYWLMIARRYANVPAQYLSFYLLHENSYYGNNPEHTEFFSQLSQEVREYNPERIISMCFYYDQPPYVDETAKYGVSSLGIQEAFSTDIECTVENETSMFISYYNHGIEGLVMPWGVRSDIQYPMYDFLDSFADDDGNDPLTINSAKEVSKIIITAAAHGDGIAKNAYGYDMRFDGKSASEDDYAEDSETIYDELLNADANRRTITIKQPINVSGVKSLGRQKLTAVCTKIHAYLSLSGEIIVHSVRRYC